MGHACSEGTTEVTQHMEIQEQSALFCEEKERGAKKTELARRETEAGPWVKSPVTTSACWIEGKSLVLLQVNCESICRKTIEFWNLVDTYSLDLVTGTESCFRAEISNTKVLRADFTTFVRDQRTYSRGVLICVKNYIAHAELWIDDFEMITVEMKGLDPKYTWQIVDI